MADDIIVAARARWERDKANWSEVYDRAREDLHFLSDDEYAQWDSVDAQARTNNGRPAITIDQLNQFVHQVSNDIRMNTPTINVIPGDNASQETAEIFKGLIKNIEYSSNADDAYDTAANFSVKSSIGFIQVDHEYVDDESPDQQLCIRRVINPLSCLIDSNSVECDGRDAKHGTIIDKMLASDFRKQWPDFEPISFDDGKGKKDSEYVYIAEHFVLVESEEEYGYLDDGTKEPFDKKKKYKTKRKLKKTKVKRYKLSGSDVLEETSFPGKYIPLVPVYGEEAWVEGKRHLHSLIRKSKGAQKMYNYWKSLETELLMKQPQAPVLAAAGSIENYTADWLDPGKSMALRYDHVDQQGNPIPKPERLAPPTIPTGIVNAARETVDDIKATMGIYNASIGQRDNETSGVAIRQRQQEGDVATYHFGDNLVRSITHVGRILVCAIPEIYDTPRIIRIIGEEDEPKAVGINGQKVADQEDEYDLRKGKYDVKVITGAPFTTRRQETVAALQEVFKASPELMTVMGDLYFKYSDFSGAHAMAERMKKVVDPKFLEENNDQDPEKEALKAQIMEGQQLMQALEQEALAMKQKLESEDESNQLEREKMQLDYDAKMKELALKAAEMEQKGREMNMKTGMEAEKLQSENLRLRLEAKTKVHPEVAMSDPDMNEGQVSPVSQMLEGLAQLIAQGQQQMAQGFENMAQLQANGDAAIIQAVNQPRKTEVIRDDQGRIQAGVSTALQ